MMNLIEIRYTVKLIERFQKLKFKYISNWPLDTNFARKQKGNEDSRDVGVTRGAEVISRRA